MVPILGFVKVLLTNKLVFVALLFAIVGAALWLIASGYNRTMRAMQRAAEEDEAHRAEMRLKRTEHDLALKRLATTHDPEQSQSPNKEQ